jgi:hypothetical protein
MRSRNGTLRQCNAVPVALERIIAGLFRAVRRPPVGLSHGYHGGIPASRSASPHSMALRTSGEANEISAHHRLGPPASPGRLRLRPHRKEAEHQTEEEAWIPNATGVLRWKLDFVAVQT